MLSEFLESCGRNGDALAHETLQGRLYLMRSVHLYTFIDLCGVAKV